MPILIVDDEVDVRESLREFFEDAGYAVATAGNGAEALELLRDGDLPCVMILDLLMPILSGPELYQRMQGDTRLASVPVIVSTSDPSRAPPGVVVMRKPIDLTRMLDRVREHCGAPA